MESLKWYRNSYQGNDQKSYYGTTRIGIGREERNKHENRRKANAGFSTQSFE
ncbi:hypothetical protein [Methylacidiphilum caldifontis]|uniref:hypothetical protein n=1 Tax=Methylacidiphilum caldifontis TaxID=2795386 RepID=UPI00141B4EF5|nr:hypothetical protein [Methylacidiphilum caldifontis]QSR88034.1 hypothetical protein IT6_06445 [Methylacidiphilum caldifontis]